MTIWLKVTMDKYELPIAVADSAKELAAITGASINTIKSSHCRYAKHGCKSPYRKVKVEEDENDK